MIEEIDIMFLDQVNLLQDIDFQGGEKLAITMVHSENRTDGYMIEKEFLIDYIKKITLKNCHIFTK